MSSNFIQYNHMEMGRVKQLIQEGKYQEALSLLWRLNQRGFQYYLPHSIPMSGTIRSLCLADVAGDSEDEIIIGTAKGEIYAIDIAPGEGSDYVIWRNSDIDAGVKMLQAGTRDPNAPFDFIWACSESGRIYVLNEEGNIVPDKDLVLTGERINCLFIDKDRKQEASTIRRIIVGTEDNKIYIYDSRSQNLLHPPIQSNIAVLSTLYSYAGEKEMIIAGSVDGHVYAFDIYDRENALPIWEYETAGHVRSIRTGDIDKDKISEVVIGSEDGYVYVLDEVGKLKWKYYVDETIFDVDVYDIDNDSNDEILLGAADGHIYVLNNEGEFRRRFEAGSRVHNVRAKYIKKDKKQELENDIEQDVKVRIIVFSTNDQLMILQVINTKELEKDVNLCFDNIKRARRNTKVPPTLRSIISELIEKEDEYIRAFAFRRLAGQKDFGQNDLGKEDFSLLLKALDDSSPVVKLEMVNIVGTLCRIDQKEGLEGISQEVLRPFLEQLAASSDRELLVALTKQLHVLANIDSVLCFEYLRRFLDHANLWVRHEVIHQLVALPEPYSSQVWELLLRATKDEHEWIRQEAAYALARYFDLHNDQLDSRIYDLWRTAVELSVISDIADAATEPPIPEVFTLLKRLHSSNMEEVQDNGKRTTISATDLEGTADVASLIYPELYRLFHAPTLEQLKEYRCAINLEQLKVPFRLMHLTDAFKRLSEISSLLQRSNQVQPLFEVFNIVEEIKRDIQISLASNEGGVLAAESIIFVALLKRWREDIQVNLHLGGAARLLLEFHERTRQKDGRITLPVQIRNEGSGTAYNVRIILEESKKEEFALIESNEYVLEKISPKMFSQVIQFSIRVMPSITEVHLSFVIIFDDPKGKNQRNNAVDKVEVQFVSSGSTAFLNPYKSNVPISSKNKEMFFDRERELQELEEKLLRTDKVIILSGLRRAGKTSLLWRLMQVLDENRNYVSIYIDLGNYFLKDSQDELFNIATSIRKQLEEKQNIGVPLPNLSDFEQSPSSAMQMFLENITSLLKDRQLLLIIDELAIMQQLIEGNVLDNDVFLRLNQFTRILLAGTLKKHRIIQVEDPWSTFMNDDNVIHFVLSPKIEAQEARRLITEPTQSFLEFDDAAIELIQRLTNNQPHPIHIICGEIISLYNKLRKRSKQQRLERVSIDTVNRAKENILSLGGTDLEWTTKELLNPVERQLLSALAQEQNDEQPIVFSTNIRERFEAFHLSYNEEEMQHAMENLIENGIVERVDSTHVIIPVGLLREWLRKNKPLRK